MLEKLSPGGKYETGELIYTRLDNKTAIPNFSFVRFSWTYSSNFVDELPHAYREEIMLQKDENIFRFTLFPSYDDQDYDVEVFDQILSTFRFVEN